MTDNPRAQASLMDALARLDEARQGWEAGERVDGDESVCVLRLGTVRPIERAARAYLAALAQPVAGEGDAELVKSLNVFAAEIDAAADYSLPIYPASHTLANALYQAARCIAPSPDHSALIRDLVEALGESKARLGGAANEIARLRIVAKLPVQKLNGIAASLSKVDAAVAAAKQAMGGEER